MTVLTEDQALAVFTATSFWMRAKGRGAANYGQRCGYVRDLGRCKWCAEKTRKVVEVAIAEKGWRF